MFLIFQIAIALVLALAFFCWPMRFLAICATIAAVILAAFMLLVLWAFDRPAVPGAIALGIILWFVVAHPHRKEDHAR